ncbi:MAG: flagellar protein [bacterium]|nr:flagellar protein [bacterium]
MSQIQPVKINNYQRPTNLLEIANRSAGSTEKAKDGSFREMFSAELAGDKGVNFSKHARERLFSRGIELSEERMTQLADAIDKAEAKGSKETLVLTDEAAMIVAVNNRTVVTVFDRDNLREGVVTHIDSAVIL